MLVHIFGNDIALREYKRDSLFFDSLLLKLDERFKMLDLYKHFKLDKELEEFAPHTLWYILINCSGYIIYSSLVNNIDEIYKKKISAGLPFSGIRIILCYISLLVLW